MRAERVRFGFALEMGWDPDSDKDWDRAGVRAGHGSSREWDGDAALERGGGDGLGGHIDSATGGGGGRGRVTKVTENLLMMVVAVGTGDSRELPRVLRPWSSPSPGSVPKATPGGSRREPPARSGSGRFPLSGGSRGGFPASGKPGYPPRHPS